MKNLKENMIIIIIIIIIIIHCYYYFELRSCKLRMHKEEES